MFYSNRIRYCLFLLLILQSSLTFSQLKYNTEEVSKAFVEAFSKSDFNAIKEMLLDKIDSLGRYDCNCADNVSKIIAGNKNLAMKGLFTIHRNMLELNIDIEKIEYKNAFLKDKYELFELYILAMYEQKYLLFLIEAIPTSNGIKFVRRINLRNDSALIAKHFKVIAPDILYA